MRYWPVKLHILPWNLSNNEMKSPLVKIIICTAALIVLLPACAGPAVHDNLTQGSGFSQQGRYAAATAENSSAAAVAPSIEVSTAQMLAAEDYDRAVAAGTAALVAAPDDVMLKEKLADAYIARAWYYKSKRLNPYAVTELFKAVEIAPKYYRAHYELGRFHNNQWQFGIGIFDLNKALSLKPDFAAAYSERAYSQYKNQQYEAGMADINKAVELDPLDPRPYCVRSLIYVATGKPELALEDADKSVQIAPSDAPSYYNRSLVYTAAGKPGSAIADLETTLRLSQDDMLTFRANADLQKLRK
jgi:tetratricopeptide (TPR) repeat protein